MMSDKVVGDKGLMMKPITKSEVVEKVMLRLIPDEEVKMLIKDQLQRRTDWIYSHNLEQRFVVLHNFVESLKEKSVVTETKDFNGDAYDFPISFAKLTFGRALKFGWCYFEDKSTTLDDAEKAMLDLYCERAQIKDGHRILDLGCGYGALAIHVASKYPHCHVIGITNTASQKIFIEEQCKNQNLNNVEVILGDITKFELNKEFDRVMVLEVLEHIKNYELLLKKISKWMKEDGLLFIENLCHKNFPYQMIKPLNEDDWIGEVIFPGTNVTIASPNLLLYFQNDVSIVNHWVLNGKHISRTSEEWLKRLDDNVDAAKAIIKDFLGSEYEAEKWINQWRNSYLHAIELGEFNNGQEWVLAQHLFKKK